MALTDRHTGSIIVSGLTENWTAEDEKPSMSGDGWDELKITYYRLSPTPLKIENVVGAFPIGMKLANRKFWLTGYAGPTCVAPGIYRLEATFKGLAATKPSVTSFSAAAQQQSAENISFQGGPPEAKVNIYENGVTAQVRYVLENVTLAPTDDVGSSQTPPGAPNVAASSWDYLTEYTYHAPNGWVLMASNTEPLAGTTVAFITDDYQYIYAISP